MDTVIDLITLSEDEGEERMDVSNSLPAIDQTGQQVANSFDEITILNPNADQNLEAPFAVDGEIKIEAIESEVIVTTTKEKYVCDFCPFSSYEEAQFISHKREHSPLIFDCSLCATRSRTPANRNLHERLAHKLKRPSELENTLFKLTPEQLAKIEEENGPFETKHKCDTCNYAFSAQSMLNNHKRQKHTGQVHCCSNCPKTFTNIFRLNNHEKLHCKVRPFNLPTHLSNRVIKPQKRKRGRPRKIPVPSEFRLSNISSDTAPRIIPTRSHDPIRAVKQETFNAIQSSNSTLHENPRDINPTAKAPTVDFKLSVARNLASERPPLAVSACFSKPQEFNTTLMLKKLTSKPSLIYYDYQMLNKQYGSLPITTWLEHPKCEILLLRLNEECSQRDLGIGHPIWKILMPRFELAPTMNRESHLMCFVKEGSKNVLERGKDAMNNYMNFVNVVSELLPALQMESSLVIANNYDRQAIQHSNLEFQQIFVP
ncbi:hypothetical protein M3Y98_01212400 [Aphelenchoides besseyi]|nr:hypothetical protein M3Y98_01212400 [Aphelenchoides besseyi]KAI6193196.1 hypothetical protein M3Y96_00992700 [Aphelenchoides besseyi]